MILSLLLLDLPKTYDGLAWRSKSKRVLTCVTAACTLFIGFGGLRDWISGYRLFDTRSPGDCSKSDPLGYPSRCRVSFVAWDRGC
jgi:hypothetical protein